MNKLLIKLHKECKYSDWINIIKKYKNKTDIKSLLLLSDMCTLAIKDTYNRTIKEGEFYIYELENIKTKALLKVQDMTGYICRRQIIVLSKQ